MKKIKTWGSNLINKIKNSDFFKTYKEEMVVIPILILMFYIINILFISMFPNGAFFDFASQIETIFYSILKFLIAIWTAHFMIRITFPKIYYHLHNNIYHNFDKLPTVYKNKYSVYILIAMLIVGGLIF